MSRHYHPTPHRSEFIMFENSCCNLCSWTCRRPVRTPVFHRDAGKPRKRGLFYPCCPIGPASNGRKACKHRGLETSTARIPPRAVPFAPKDSSSSTTLRRSRVAHAVRGLRPRELLVDQRQKMAPRGERPREYLGLRSRFEYDLTVIGITNSYHQVADANVP